jgi:hypothetical protein
VSLAQVFQTKTSQKEEEEEEEKERQDVEEVQGLGFRNVDTFRKQNFVDQVLLEFKQKYRPKRPLPFSTLLCTQVH